MHINEGLLSLTLCILIQFPFFAGLPFFFKHLLHILMRVHAKDYYFVVIVVVFFFFAFLRLTNHGAGVFLISLLFI